MFLPRVYMGKTKERAINSAESPEEVPPRRRNSFGPRQRDSGPSIGMPRRNAAPWNVLRATNYSTRRRLMSAFGKELPSLLLKAYFYLFPWLL